MARSSGFTLAGLLFVMAVVAAFSATAFPWVCRNDGGPAQGCYVQTVDGYGCDDDTPAAWTDSVDATAPAPRR